MKNDEVRQKILDCAKEEFLEKDYMSASMRSIAERAGYTTGILYSRFADKDEIFGALVSKGAEELYSYFENTQNEFASLNAQVQISEQHTYVDKKVDRMIDIIYGNFDAFKLIVCKSKGSSYEFYIDRLVAVEMFHTDRYISVLRSEGIKAEDVRHDFSHMVSSALFNGMFEVVAHDLPKSDALIYVKKLQIFFNAGWDRIFGII